MAETGDATGRSVRRGADSPGRRARWTEEFSKSERRHLRRQAGLAYERELTRALEELAAEFRRWREGELAAVELSEAIHEYHEEEARHLFGLYNRLKEPMLVARAVAAGLLEEAEVRKPVLAKLERQITFFREQSGAT